MNQKQLNRLLHRAVDENKNKQLNIRITESELQLLQLVQECAGIGAGELIRALIRQAAIDVVQDGECSVLKIGIQNA